MCVQHNKLANLLAIPFTCIQGSRNEWNVHCRSYEEASDLWNPDYNSSQPVTRLSERMFRQIKTLGTRQNKSLLHKLLEYA